MTTSKQLEDCRSSFSLFQLAVGATLTFIGVAAILRISNFWTATDVRYAEYAVLLLWGVLLMVGALRQK